jgi:hypothetical protein
MPTAPEAFPAPSPPILKSLQSMVTLLAAMVMALPVVMASTPLIVSLTRKFALRRARMRSR